MTKYDRKCLSLTEDEVQERLSKRESSAIRMLVPEGVTSFQDLVFGRVSFDNKTLDDQVLMKSDGFPTYHFANVVDDYTMRISHVIRGQEWLPSTPKHLLLYKMLEIEPPLFAHLPLLVDMQGRKLSKRFGDVSVSSFREKGFLPEAIVNGVSLLGWTPPSHDDPRNVEKMGRDFARTETMTMEDLQTFFQIQKVSKAPAKFDEVKFRFFNG